ncbi:MAG: nucleotide exchange factor GrpE [Gammaproteobacteria bacterium]|nr:nucleotide exchange factor GrpE [Gammaproteobacteria bacterium]
MNANNPSEAAAEAQVPIDSPTGESTDAADALAAAQAKAQENWNAYLRAVAELENFRKRSERELDQARKFAIERFAQELVTVADALEAAIASAAGGPDRAHLEGVQATLRQLYRAFEKVGIQIIDPAGKPFDPSWHEAMVAQESAEAAPDTILTVVQKGYSLNGRLLRPARVVVSRAPGGGR